MKGHSLSEATYSIAAVSKLSGVSCHTLRVWERRYGFPVPLRLASGHRRYPADQVHLICQVARRCQYGGSIAQNIAQARDEQTQSEPGAFIPSASDHSIAELLDQLRLADTSEAERTFERLTCHLSIPEIANQIITPALTESGERLFRKDCTLIEERLTSMFLLRKLATLVDHAQAANTRPIGRVLVLVMQGDRHEGGALMLSLALELAGWRALFLGADLPIQEIQHGINTWKPAAVGVSLSLSRNIRKRFNELAKLRGAPVFVGGRSIVNYQGLAKRCSLGVVLGPAIPNVGRYLQGHLESDSHEGSDSLDTGDRSEYLRSESMRFEDVSNHSEFPTSTSSPNRRLRWNDGEQEPEGQNRSSSSN